MQASSSLFKQRKGRLDREIGRLALPAVAATLTIPLLSLADTAFAGRMGSPVYLGAIAVGGNFFSMLFWLFGFLRMGAGAITAQAFGAGDFLAARILLKRFSAIAIVVGAIMIAVQGPLLEGFRRVMDIEPDVWAPASTYIRIMIWGAPAALMAYVWSGWFLGMQSSRSAMVTSISVDLINIGATALLVFAADMKVEGIAYGTLGAQWAGLAIAMWHVGSLWKKHPVKKAGEHKRISIHAGRLIKVNSDIILRTACLLGVTLWFTREGAEQGALTLAANSIVLQFFLLFSYFVDGLAYAGEALTGRFVGAESPKRCRLMTRRLMQLSFRLSAVFSVVYLLGGPFILHLLSDEADVRVAAEAYLGWAAAIPAVSFAAFIWDGIFIGATLTRRMLLAMAIASALFFVVTIALTLVMGNHALWLGLVVYLGARSGFMTLLRPAFVRKDRRRNEPRRPSSGRQNACRRTPA